ncbi:hypothetical protein C8J56DRAFT_1045523 [Mycena floridula]|nr:hypothetical protein C8J56DRAFT_1045523 [Mycena floridula]
MNIQDILSNSSPLHHHPYRAPSQAISISSASSDSLPSPNDVGAEFYDNPPQYSAEWEYHTVEPKEPLAGLEFHHHSSDSFRQAVGEDFSLAGAPPAKRPRGRPPKPKAVRAETPSSPSPNISTKVKLSAKKCLGRPPKLKPPRVETPSSPSSHISTKVKASRAKAAVIDIEADEEPQAVPTFDIAMHVLMPVIAPTAWKGKNRGAAVKPELLTFGPIALSYSIDWDDFLSAITAEVGCKTANRLQVSSFRWKPSTPMNAPTLGLCTPANLAAFINDVRDPCGWCGKHVDI